jgi:hypothetical protein
MRKIILVLAVCMLSIISLFSGCVNSPNNVTPGPEEPALPAATPSIVITVDSDANKLFVTGTDMNVKWSDIVITTDNQAASWQVYSGGGVPLDLPNDTNRTTTDVTAGDYVALSGTSGIVKVAMRYVPTNSLLGTWTINV